MVGSINSMSFFAAVAVNRIGSELASDLDEGGMSHSLHQKRNAGIG